MIWWNLAIDLMILKHLSHSHNVFSISLLLNAVIDTQKHEATHRLPHVCLHVFVSLAVLFYPTLCEHDMRSRRQFANSSLSLSLSSLTVGKQICTPVSLSHCSCCENRWKEISESLSHMSTRISCLSSFPSLWWLCERQFIQISLLPHWFNHLLLQTARRLLSFWFRYSGRVTSRRETCSHSRVHSVTL